MRYFVVILALSVCCCFASTCFSATNVTNNSTEIEKLTNKIAELDDFNKSFNRGWGWVLGINAVVFFVAGVSIVQGYFFINKTLTAQITKYTKEKMKEVVYRVDPTWKSVTLVGHNLDLEFKRLKELDFKNARLIDNFDADCVAGCVVVKITSEHHHSIDAFIAFLDKNKEIIEKNKAAFIIYTERRDLTLDDKYRHFVTFANTPLTLPNAVFTVCRAIPQKID